MRLLHTSDWHLGRRLNEYPLLEEQAAALEDLAKLCREERVDALLLAGDVFDRSVPPEDAVRVFSDFLHRMATEVKIPVIAISGNHDSAERLGFGAEFLARGGVHLLTRFDRRAEPVLVEARGEKVQVFGLPYTEPAEVRAALSDETVRTHDDAVRAALVDVRRSAQASGVPSVLLAHLFAIGGTESPDSERTLEIGGAAQVELASLAGFSYVALGHLHAPQRVGGRDDIRYSGSLMKYSVSEAGQKKGVTLVEIDAGAVRIHELALPTRRDVVRLEGTLQELLEHPRFEVHRDDYVEATYTDAGYHLDVAPRLRERFRFLLAAVPRALLEATDASSSELGSEWALRDTRALLEGFWGHVVGEVEPLGEAHHAAFQEVLGELEGVAVAEPIEREVAA